MTTGKAMKTALAILALGASAARAQQHTIPLGDLLPEDRVVTAAGLAAGTAQAAGQAVTNAVNAGYLCTVQAANAIAAGRAGRDELNAAVQGLALALAPLASTGQVALAVAPALASLGAHTGNDAIHLTLNQAAKIAAALTAESDPAALPLIAAHTNAADIHLTPGQAARIAAALTAEADTNALEKIAALSTNRVTRWYDPEDPLRWAEWDGGTNIVIFVSTPTSVVYVVAINEGFNAPSGNPPWVYHSFPFAREGSWSGSLEYYPDSGNYMPRVVNWVDVGGGEYVPVAAWEGTSASFPIDLAVIDGGGSGTATVSTRPGQRIPVAVSRYYLPTNMIPPELANLDLLQAWLNNYYYTKAQADTNFVTLADKELHADSYTNLIWRSVFSNGWHWLVAYTNTP